MGRPINNLRKAGLRVKQNKEGYKQLVALADRVASFLTGNANFATPLPTPVNITAAADALRTAAAFMGGKRNRASKAEKLDAQFKATAVRDILTASLKYIIQTALIAAGGDVPLFNNIVVSSGFGLSDVRSINARAQVATFVRQDNSKLHPGSEHRLNWRRPIGLIKGAKVAGYNIYIGGVIVQTTTKTSTVIPVAAGVNQDVMIVPFNSRGTGQPFFATVKGMS